MKHALRSAAVVLVLLTATAGAAADDLQPPAVVASGFAAYKAGGPVAAIKAWLKGSPLEESKEALSQANMLNQIHDFYGPYKSYDVLQVHAIGASSQIVYLSINCEQGPVFGKFLLFKRGDAWIVPSFRFHTEADQVLPGVLLAH